MDLPERKRNDISKTNRYNFKNEIRETGITKDDS